MPHSRARLTSSLSFINGPNENECLFWKICKTLIIKMNGNILEYLHDNFKKVLSKGRATEKGRIEEVDTTVRNRQTTPVAFSRKLVV